MQSFFIYTYGGYGDMIATIFNGMARLFASNSEYFTSVGKLSMSVGAVWAATRAIFNANIGFFGKAWFAPTFLAFTFLFTPKASVIIRDEVAKTEHKVDNIPFAIAFFSSTPSIISHYIASQVEEQFKTVDMSSRPNLMFGAKLIARFKEVKVQDPVLLENSKEFMRQCFIRPWIMGNILDKKQAAETTDNLFAFMKANQANNFGMYYKQAGGNVVFKTCVENTEVILKALEKEAKSDKLLGNLGLALGVGNNNMQNLAKELTATGTDALTALSKGSYGVHNWVRQAMMLNVYRESLDDWREGAGYQRLWPEVISMNATRGLYQQSFGWITAGEMAAQFLPLLQTIMFLMVVSSIVVIFPLSMLPGGIEVLKIWVQAMMWVNTWPIFFAVVNCIGMNVLASKSKALGISYGMDKMTQGSFSDMIIHTYAIVQMFASLVPVFSWMLISKSSYAFTGMVERMSPVGVAGSLGSATVDNTLSMDNVSYGNRQLNQANVGANLDMTSSINSGAVKVIQSANGQHFIEERASNLATNYRGSELESIALNNAYSETASSMEALSRRQGQLSSLESSQLKDYSQRWLSGKDASSGTNQSVVEAANRLASTGASSSENHSSRDSKSTDTHATLNAGGSLFGVGGSAGVSAKNSSDASHDKSVGSNMSYQEAENIMRNYAKNHDLRDSSGKSESVSENLQKTWRDQEQVAVDKSNTQQRMNSLQQQMSYTSQNAASIDSNYNDKVLDETAARYGLSNKAEALAYLNANPNEGKQVLQDLVAQKYGSSMSIQVANKGSGLANQVDHSLNTNLDTHHKEAKENLKRRYNDISNDKNDEMNSRASEVKRAVDNNINTTGETINNGKLDLDSKINSTQEKIKQDQQDTQEKFDRTSNSTIYRSFEKAGQNTVKPVVEVASKNPIIDSDTDQYAPVIPTRDKK